MEAEGGEGTGFVSPLTFHPSRGRKPAASLATFLTEARGASLDNANELWTGLSQGAANGRAEGLARRD